MIASTLTSASIGEIARAGGRAPWFQLYPTADRGLTRALLERAEAAGCEVVALTTDVPVTGNRETQTDVLGRLRRGELTLGNFDSLPEQMFDAGLTWRDVEWLEGQTRMKVVLKGIVRRDDARLAAQHGVDAVIVSNHGGRQEESNRASLESLPEVLEGCAGALPVLMDGGVRRGTDVFKALALGARACCIGRPYAWGLAAFGQAGVERVLELLQAELVLAMRLAGTPRLADIGRDYVAEPGPLLGG
jgi:isopentenyl diphosphate isomerase/L-lactate dehydrogenase-like FMN-dependent dehydrogenase